MMYVIIWKMKSQRSYVVCLLLCLVIVTSAFEAGMSAGYGIGAQSDGNSGSGQDGSQEDPEPSENEPENCASDEKVESICKDIDKDIKEGEDIELNMVENGHIVKEKISHIGMFRLISKDPTISLMVKGHMPFEIVTKRLSENCSLSHDQLQNINLNGENCKELKEKCLKMQPEIKCDPDYKYRTPDGRCNNIENPTWGMAMSCQQRMLPPNYSDGYEFRTTKDGDPLPEPRILSLNINWDRNHTDDNISHMFMYFGQLLDHDLGMTPASTIGDNQAIECCHGENKTLPQCRPIKIAPDDPFYKQFGKTCINFVRSAPCPTCNMGPRVQMDALTSYIDASFVYGNDENETKSLRTNDGTGSLKNLINEHGSFPPQCEKDMCSSTDGENYCAKAGDSRVNQHITLTSLHTIFMREHNRIVAELKIINPHWDEDTLFEEGRRIVGAEMQCITYNYWLPTLLGEPIMSAYDLWLPEDGRTPYDSAINPTMIIEFTTAAFRIGHTFINNVVAKTLKNADGQVRLLRYEFCEPKEVFTILDSTIKDTSTSGAQHFDQNIVEDVTNYLYRMPDAKFGMDLASINIQRGRDHGLPTYKDVALFCSEECEVIEDFDDLVKCKLMEEEQKKVLEKNYRYVDDIDLWIGILSEIPYNGAMIGRTAVCIIALQFKKLKFGDRFYVSHEKEAGSFTEDQYKQLRSVSLADIFCLNTNISEIPKNPFKLIHDEENPIISCDDVTGIDLSHWKDLKQ